MKFFSREWASGEMCDSEGDEMIVAYERHIDHVATRLPASARCLARELNLHDGLIRRVTYDKAGRELRLELRCGDNQLGYFDLDLTYLGAILDRSDVAVLREVARDAETELWYDEVDLAEEGMFLHRMLFYPARECEIMFRGLGLRVIPRDDRRIADLPQVR